MDMFIDMLTHCNDVGKCYDLLSSGMRTNRRTHVEMRDPAADASSPELNADWGENPESWWDDSAKAIPRNFVDDDFKLAAVETLEAILVHLTSVIKNVSVACGDPYS